MITLRFTYRKRKIWLNIKTSQNTMTMTASKFSFTFYVFINSSNCKKEAPKPNLQMFMNMIVDSAPLNKSFLNLLLDNFS